MFTTALIIKVALHLQLKVIFSEYQNNLKLDSSTLYLTIYFKAIKQMLQEESLTV